MLTVTLTNDQWSIIVQLLDKVQGMENAKVLLPIYEAIKAAAQANAPSPAGDVEFKEEAA